MKANPFVYDRLAYFLAGLPKNVLIREDSGMRAGFAFSERRFNDG